MRSASDSASTDAGRRGASAAAVQRAEADYRRLRAAYLQLARHDPGHEVALAMIGADMDQAHARLQELLGLPRLPFTREPSLVIRGEAQRLAAEEV